MVKFIDITTYDCKATGTTFTEESQTRQSDYEDINSMVSRIIRGEIIPQMPDEFEYDGSESVEDMLNSNHPLDVEDLDISDFGSVYQDDVRSGIDDFLNNKQNQQVTNQERELSGANQQSSSETNGPVDNLEKVDNQE